MNSGGTDYINGYLLTDSFTILYEEIMGLLREIFIDLMQMIYNTMSNWIFYFIITNYNTWNDEIYKLYIEYNHFQEPYFIWRDNLIKEWYKVKWMYWREGYAIEALKLSK